MTIRFDINQAEAFRRGINCEKSIVHLNIDPAKVSQEDRNLIANRLIGIDVVQLFFSRGQIVKGFPFPDLIGLSDPCRISANTPDFDGLMEAIRENENEIQSASREFERQQIQPILLKEMPKELGSYVLLHSSNPTSTVDLVSRLRRGEKVTIDEIAIETVNRDLKPLLLRQRYIVKIVPIAGKTAHASFLFDPPDTVHYRFRAPFLGKEVAANTYVVLYNEKTGSVAEVDSVQQALALYLRLAIQPRVDCNELNILQWTGDRWAIIPPEAVK